MTGQVRTDGAILEMVHLYSTVAAALNQAVKRAVARLG